MSISKFDNLKTVCESGTKSSDGHVDAHHWRSLNDLLFKVCNAAFGAHLKGRYVFNCCHSELKCRSPLLAVMHSFALRPLD